jgi:hypothetical protein
MSLGKGGQEVFDAEAVYFDDLAGNKGFCPMVGTNWCGQDDLWELQPANIPLE